MNKSIIVIVFILLIVSTMSIKLIVSYSRSDITDRITIDKSLILMTDEGYHNFKLEIASILKLDYNLFEIEVFNELIGKYIKYNETNYTSFRRILIIEKESELSPLNTLQITGRMFPDITTLYVNNHHILIHEIDSVDLGTGLITWDASILLAKYFEHSSLNSTNSSLNPSLNPSLNWLENKRIIELGAGTGVVGITAALLGAEEVVVTDMAYTLNNLKNNVKLNFPTLNNSNSNNTTSSNAGGSSSTASSASTCYYVDTESDITNQTTISNTSLNTGQLPVEGSELLPSSSSRPTHTISVAELEWGKPSTYIYPTTTGTGPVRCDRSGAAADVAPPEINSINSTTDSSSSNSGSGSNTWDIVIGADIVWLEHLEPLLMHALDALCGPHTVLYLSHQVSNNRHVYMHICNVLQSIYTCVIYYSILFFLIHLLHILT